MRIEAKPQNRDEMSTKMTDVMIWALVMRYETKKKIIPRARHTEGCSVAVEMEKPDRSPTWVALLSHGQVEFRFNHTNKRCRIIKQKPGTNVTPHNSMGKKI